MDFHLKIRGLTALTDRTIPSVCLINDIGLIIRKKIKYSFLGDAHTPKPFEFDSWVLTMDQRIPEYFDVVLPIPEYSKVPKVGSKGISIPARGSFNLICVRNVRHFLAITLQKILTSLVFQ